MKYSPSNIATASAATSCLVLLAAVTGFASASGSSSPLAQPGYPNPTSGWSQPIGMATMTMNNSSVDVMSLRANLEAALQQHVNLAVPTFKAQLYNEPDLSLFMNLVEQNNTDIANLVHTVYPNSSEAEFLSLWRSHIGYYSDYLTATQNKDESGRQAAKQHLAAFADQLSTWLVNQNSAYNKSTLQQAIATHGDQTTAIIDNLVAGNDDQVYSLANQACQHMVMFADMLVQPFDNQAMPTMSSM